MKRILAVLLLSCLLLPLSSCSLLVPSSIEWDGQLLETKLLSNGVTVNIIQVGEAMPDRTLEIRYPELTLLEEARINNYTDKHWYGVKGNNGWSGFYFGEYEEGEMPVAEEIPNCSTDQEYTEQARCYINKLGLPKILKGKYLARVEKTENLVDVYFYPQVNGVLLCANKYYTPPTSKSASASPLSLLLDDTMRYFITIPAVAMIRFEKDTGKIIKAYYQKWQVVKESVLTEEIRVSALDAVDIFEQLTKNSGYIPKENENLYVQPFYVTIDQKSGKTIPAWCVGYGKDMFGWPERVMISALTGEQIRIIGGE